MNNEHPWALDPETFSVSIVIPAYNEEPFLPDTLVALDAAMNEIGERGQVIVVDNNSTDATARVAEEHGAEVVFEPVNQISRARNAGAAAAGGKHLIFLDADTLLPAELLRTALDNLESGTCCGGGALVIKRRSARRRRAGEDSSSGRRGSQRTTSP